MKRQATPEVPIWLHVQTITTPAPVKTTAAALARIPHTLNASIQSAPLDTLSAKAKPCHKRKLKTVRFDTSASDTKRAEATQAGPSGQSSAQSFATLDLKATNSICDHLSRHCSSTSNCADPCLGYLEYLGAPLSSRLIFYDASKNATTQKSKPKLSRDALPVNGLLRTFRTLHQLTLAHQLAVATLQYHSTSWLSADWRLQDISYFDDSTRQSMDTIDEQLQSLHLSTQFPPSSTSSLDQTSISHQDLKYIYGIRNLPLAKLGIALLEISCQKDINDLTTAPTPHEVISARRILLDPPSSMQSLGARYLKIVQKCIECDFSCGDDLSDGDLRSAVYTEVICALEEMIVDWKKFLGIT